MLLIFDEVVTGFRHDLGGFQRLVGVMPDLTTLGKAMANGWPISAIGGRADLMELFSTTPGRPAFFAGTFNGHPAMAAGALATIQKLESEPVHEHLFGLGEKVRKGLAEIFQQLNVPAVVTGFGSVFVTYFLDGPVESYADLLRNDVDLFTGYRRRLMHHGIFELPLNLKRSNVSYAHSAEDIDRLLEATETCVKEVLQTPSVKPAHGASDDSPPSTVHLRNSSPRERSIFEDNGSQDYTTAVARGRRPRRRNPRCPYRKG